MIKEYIQLNIPSLFGLGMAQMLVDIIPELTAISLLLVIYINLEIALLGKNRGIVHRIRQWFKNKKKKGA